VGDVAPQPGSPTGWPIQPGLNSSPSRAGTSQPPPGSPSAALSGAYGLGGLSNLGGGSVSGPRHPMMVQLLASQLAMVPPSQQQPATSTMAAATASEAAAGAAGAASLAAVAKELHQQQLLLAQHTQQQDQTHQDWCAPRLFGRQRREDLLA
jgi:hypothetical protein